MTGGLLSRGEVSVREGVELVGILLSKGVSVHRDVSVFRGGPLSHRPPKFAVRLAELCECILVQNSL